MQPFLVGEGGRKTFEDWGRVEILGLEEVTFAGGQYPIKCHLSCAKSLVELWPWICLKQNQLNHYHSYTYLHLPALPTLCEKCPYSELFWFAFSRIWTKITLNTDTFHTVYVKWDSIPISLEWHCFAAWEGNNFNLLDKSNCSRSAPLQSIVLDLHLCNLSIF